MSWAEDRLEILQLIATYSHRADSSDSALFAECFTDDGEFHVRVGLPDESRFKGRAEIEQFHARAVASRGGAQTRHLQNNTLFLEQSENEARARTYLLVTRMQGENPPENMHTSVYEDTIVKTPQGWKFKLRRTLSDRKPSA